MFDPEVLSQCAAVYPDNPNNPTANNVVLQNATTNFLNHSYAAGPLRAAAFSWQATAHATLDAIEDAVRLFRL
jgi:hypothetical protein